MGASDDLHRVVLNGHGFGNYRLEFKRSGLYFTRSKQPTRSFWWISCSECIERCVGGAVVVADGDGCSWKWVVSDRDRAVWIFLLLPVKANRQRPLTEEHSVLTLHCSEGLE
jgi:hypothetical protein